VQAGPGCLEFPARLAFPVFPAHLEFQAVPARPAFPVFPVFPARLEFQAVRARPEFLGFLVFPVHPEFQAVPGRLESPEFRAFLEFRVPACREFPALPDHRADFRKWGRVLERLRDGRRSTRTPLRRG
jgi:hypothetical protein